MQKLDYSELAKVINRNREGIIMNGRADRQLSPYDNGQLTMLIYIMKDVAKGMTDEAKRAFYTLCGYPGASLE